MIREGGGAGQQNSKGEARYCRKDGRPESHVYLLLQSCGWVTHLQSFIVFRACQPLPLATGEFRSCQFVEFVASKNRHEFHEKIFDSTALVRAWRSGETREILL